MKTYESSDALDRQPFGRLLYGLLQSEYILADESFVVALTGGFGSGKSHFLEMWEQKIVCEENGPQVVHINAWESDHSGEPVLAIVSAISKQLKAANTPGENAMATLKSAAGRIALGAVSLTKQAALGYLEAQTNLNWDSTLEAMKEGSGKGGMNKVALSLFSEHEARSKAIEDLRRALADLIAGSDGLKLILVVDELDRCRPTYAIDFLEALKHFFNIKGLAVLLAVDWEQLSSTSRALFGCDLDPNEYLRKFVTRKVPLPEAGAKELRVLLQKLWERFVSSDVLERANRSTSAPSISEVEQSLACIIFAMGVSRPRQIEEIFRVVSHYFYASPGDSRQGLDDSFIQIFSLIVLQIVDPKLFHQISNGTASVDDCLKFALGITRFQRSDIKWSRDWGDGVIINGLVDRSNCSEFEGKYIQEIDKQPYRGPQHEFDAPHFSTGLPESPMRIMAKKLSSLKRFSHG